ncbi:MAG: LysR family transcriptional regulator [Moraxella sp.]|nr:LysR family transcriptional regulator [Moraxella sp.]
MDIDEELTLKKVQIFLTFMRYGNLGKTSEELGVSTVSVHKAIHSLEESLKCPLFRREGRLLIPLKSAYVFAEYAQKIVHDVTLMVNKTRESAGFDAKVMNIGSLYSLSVNTLPRLISGLKIRRNKLDIQLLFGSNKDLVKKLKDTELDAIVVALNDTTVDMDFETLPILFDEVFLAVNSQSDYAKLDEIDLRQLKDEAFITLTKGFATHHDSEMIFQKAEFSPNVALQVGDIFTLISMVRSGIGCALLPGRIFSVYQNSITLIPLKSPYRLTQTIGLVFLKSKERDPNILALLAECRMFAKGSAHPLCSQINSL